MSRLRQVDPGQLDPAGQASYERILGGLNGRPGYVAQTRIDGVYGLLAHSPELAARVCSVGDEILGAGGIEVTDKEITCLAVARHTNCQLEWTLHEPRSRLAGVREEVIAGIKARRLDGFTDRERLFVDFSWEVLSNDVSDETWAAMHRLMGDRGTVNVTLQISFVALICQCMDAFAMELAPGVAPLLPIDR